MDVGKPFNTISRGVELDVLVALAGSTEPMSGRDLARRTGRSNTGVHHVLDHLVEHGLVNRGEAGRTFLYTLNRDHLLAPTVEAMAQAGHELVRRLRDEIAAWHIAPLHASLFGSAARGDGDATSDIDLLLVRPRRVDAEDQSWRKQVDELARSVWRWTGNKAGIVEIAESELPRLRKQRPAVVEEVMDDAIDLFGEPTRKLLKKI